MLRPETEFKINKIVDFLKSNNKAQYTISFSLQESENVLNVPIYSYGEILNIVMNVNNEIGNSFFDFDQFKNLTATIDKPLYISITELK
jgi:hypothetical protein